MKTDHLSDSTGNYWMNQSDIPAYIFIYCQSLPIHVSLPVMLPASSGRLVSLKGQGFREPSKSLFVIKSFQPI